MAKLTLSNLANLQNEATATAVINENNSLISTAMENTLSRDGTTPNTMGSNLDMNSNRIVNLPEPVSSTEPLRLVDVDVATITQMEAIKDAVIAAQEAAEAAQASAETAETNAETAETNAETAETNAEAAQAAAEAAQSAAESAQTAAEAAQLAAETAEMNAASSESAAAISESNAAISEANAATSETNASNSEIAALAAQVAAEQARDEAEVAADNFDDVYYGTKSADPTTDNDGDPIDEGDLYFNTVSHSLKIYDGSAWQAYSPASGITSVNDDTNPTLGGDLDRNGFDILGMVIGTDIEPYDATILKSADIGSTVQGYDVDTLKADTSDNLTAGFTTTSYNAGTKSSGTFTPDPANGNFQHATNGGAHTLAPPSNTCTMVIEYLNNGSAGTITTSGFTKVTGEDDLNTVDTNKFLFFITKSNSYSHLQIQPLQ